MVQRDIEQLLVICRLSPDWPEQSNNNGKNGTNGTKEETKSDASRGQHPSSLVLTLPPNIRLYAFLQRVTRDFPRRDPPAYAE